MKKALMTLALLPLLGSGCWFAPKPQATEPILQVPSQQQATDTRSEQPAEPTVETNNDPSLKPDQNSYVVVKDQTAGSEVMLDYVLIQKRGFAVIHEDKDGSPDKIIGSSTLLNAGEMREAFIKTKTESGKTYWAMLHFDDGDGKFDAKKDLPVKDSKEATVMAKFKTL